MASSPCSATCAASSSIFTAPTTTQNIDALCHFLYKDHAFNGYSRAEVESTSGCAKLGIDHLKAGIVTRGILIDMPRLRNVPYLEPATPVYIEDLEAWERKAGVRIAAGDAILLTVAIRNLAHRRYI